MQQLVNVIESGLKKLLITLCALIVLGVTWQVFSRYVLQSPSSTTEELARFLLIWIGLFGAAYAYKMDSHLGLDVVVNKFNQQVRPWANVFAHVVVLFFAVAVMIIGGFSLVNLTMDPTQISAALQVKMGFIYSAVPISGIIISIFSLQKIANQISAIVSTGE
ncbi:TRAP transporter small permease (plasmid) [Saccharobesus litoralis]|uniref:TRAP transporter small permease protein n=1 Tax=Saccharobesus litoralis TaxID=2172099 RepID=A0A2S0VYD1_9ALTE|nr:TRAP transporter small permease [Saccharobesus litoralis]AWB69203.1 TRAP transporter small permease [Saccharobesus litoralis]